MSFSFKDKIRYRFEQYLNKGGASIFVSLFVVFLALFILIIGIRVLILQFADAGPDATYDGTGDDIWRTWLQMTDPGNMNQDNYMSIWVKISTVIAGLVGVIILSMLIAFITTSLEKVLYNFRKGRGKVLEHDHTLILGWNERVVDIIRELIIANESESDASVVILSDHDKEQMDDIISKRLPDTKTTRVITTTGDFANINELERVGLTRARSVIILAGCGESASQDDKIASDVQAVKSIMAIITSQDGENKIPIIAEIFSDEKRELVSFFNDDNIIAIDSWDIMGKLLVQTSLTSGLEMVYNEMLSFDGCEVYFKEGKWNNVKFGDLAFHFKDGIPMGVYNEEDGIQLRPAEDYQLKKQDQVIILADDDSTIHFETNAFIQPNRSYNITGKKLEKGKKDILILGWHNVARIFIREAFDYLSEGSRFKVVFNDPPQELIDEINSLSEEYEGFELELINSNPLKLDCLKELDPFSHDNVIILSQDEEEQNADKIDSDTLIILLLLRKIKNDSGEANAHIITQVLNSENQDIITQTDVDDFIISNKLITMILAQLSEEPLVKLLYDDLFSEDGSEIYVKPAFLYFESFPHKVRFADLMALASKREEICLGIRKGSLSKDKNQNFGVKLNLAKDEMVEITEEDFLVVLSEDEL